INNYVAVGDFEGYLHLLSQIDGRIVGRTRIDNDGVRSNLLVKDGWLYAYGNSGRLTALSLR
ncbi:MAG: outer membrane protein assembly factor BamB, partial [Pseudomonadota bacterium]|nr:outer membrane protein assembly factor BamB [Pseudomonadota bacterium]